MFPGSHYKAGRVTSAGFTAKVGSKVDGFPLKVSATSAAGDPLSGIAAKYHAYVPYIEEEGVKLSNTIKIIVVGTHPPGSLGKLLHAL